MVIGVGKPNNSGAGGIDGVVSLDESPETNAVPPEIVRLNERVKSIDYQAHFTVVLSVLKLLILWRHA